MKRKPRYPLERVQALILGGEKGYRISRVARDGAAELHLDEQDIVACVCRLDDGDFYKSMPAEKSLGDWQDVYKAKYCGFSIYLKVQIVERAGSVAVVISFKRDESR